MKNWKQIAKKFFPKEFEEFKRTLSDGRRPDSVEFGDIETDVRRRDLTINALFYDIDTNEVVDLVGGVNDLKNGIVKTVGSAEDRFGEDKLRILRAIRFAGRFNSDLDPSVDKALKKSTDLTGVSSERIRDEFLKGLKTSKSVIHYLQLLNRYNLFDWVFKGLNVNKDFIDERDPAVQISWLLINNEPDLIAKVLNKLTYSSNEVKAITFLVALKDFNVNSVVGFKKLQIKSGVHSDLIKKFGKLIAFDENTLVAFLEFNLTVTGQDAMDAGIQNGPDIGRFINKMEIDNFKKLLS